MKDKKYILLIIAVCILLIGGLIILKKSKGNSDIMNTVNIEISVKDYGIIKLELDGQTAPETVRNFEEYLPEFFPIVHPSPLNFRWQKNNPWFENEVVPVLREYVNNILS